MTLVGNETHNEIKSLSDKFDKVHSRIDESSAKLEEEIERAFQESKQDRVEDKKEVADVLRSKDIRNRWVAGILIALAYWTVNTFNTNIDNMNAEFLGELKEVNKNLVILAEKTSSQDSKIDVINVKLDRQTALETMYQSLDKEVQGLRLDMEKRLGNP